MNFNSTILLTGAGFTANFGGFLAKEMWSKIFNNPLLNEAGNLKIALRNNLDFEKIYSDVVDSRIPNLHPHERNAFVKALNEAYLEMDNTLKDPSWETLGIHPADLRKFLEFFTNNDDGKVSICFTLNQDLFMERHFGWQPLGPPAMRYKGSFGNIDKNDLDSTSPKILPNETELQEYLSTISTGFMYVKLHGSQKWVAHDNRDTKILGINKGEAIERIPLLKSYFALFEQALLREGVRLVVIGYSFNDNHINACIVKAINEYHLKLYVVSTENPVDFSFRMRFKYPRGTAINDQDDGKLPIWNAIEGYFPYELKRVFPHPQRWSAEKAEIFKAISIPLIR